MAYAAAAGTTAADGTGRNSPYTSALMAHLDEPLEILAEDEDNQLAWNFGLVSRICG